MPKPAAPTATPEEEFDASFAEALAADATLAPDATLSAPPEPGEEPEAPAQEPKEPPPPAEPAKPGDTPPPEEPPPEETPPEEPPAETPEARIARLEAENAALRAPKAAPAPTPQPAAETPPEAPKTAPAAPSEGDTAPKEPVWYQPDDKEKQILADLESNWPDIHAAQQVAIKQAVYNAVQYTFNAIAKQYNPAIQRFAELSDVISEQLALSALRSEHEDYDEVYDKVVAWVDTLPVAFKNGAKAVMESGTPLEVAELVSEYKRLHPAAAATGATPVVPAVPAVPAARKTELTPAARQAASKLRVVGSKRTTPVVAADPNDFNAAWNEAIAGS